MAAEGGYIKIYRSLWEHPLFQGNMEFSRREAWLDMLCRAWWNGDKPAQSVVRNKVVTWKRGQLTASLRFLGERWGWSKNRVDRFLGQLKDNGSIKIGTLHGTDQTLITICNYDTYNPPTDIDGTRSGHERDANGTRAENGTPQKSVTSSNKGVSDVKSNSGGTQTGRPRDAHGTPVGQSKKKVKEGKEIKEGKGLSDAAASESAPQTPSDPKNRRRAPSPNPLSAAPFSSPPAARLSRAEAVWFFLECDLKWSAKVFQKWCTLCEQKRWKVRTHQELQEILESLKEYPEGFVLDQVSTAIRRNWADLIYDETPLKFKAWLAKQPPEPNSTLVIPLSQQPNNGRSYDEEL